MKVKGDVIYGGCHALAGRYLGKAMAIICVNINSSEKPPLDIKFRPRWAENFIRYFMRILTNQRNLALISVLPLVKKIRI